MRERPILFSGPMVRAILEGRKTQTRRVVKFEFVKTIPVPENSAFREGTEWKSECPFGQPGDRLWVRETFGYEWKRDAVGGTGKRRIYRATESDLSRFMPPWRPSIHMPRWASRLTLEITAVRVERLQDITEEDAKNEGIESVEVGDFYGWKNYQFKTANPRHGSVINDEEHRIHAYQSAAASFKSLWKSIYNNWDASPYVWVVEFRKVEDNR